MSVPVNDRYFRAIASGASSGEVFTFDFPILVATDVQVEWINNDTGIVTTLVLNEDYTVNLITQTVTITGTTVNGDIYVFIGVTPYARDTDFSGATGVTTNALNTDYNEEEKQIQQIARDIEFCVRMPLSDNPATINMELPTADVRKNLYLKFDANGNVEVAAGTGGGSGDVIGPNSSTDNAIVRWDGPSGALIQNSTAILSDSGGLSGLTQLNVDNIQIDGNTISATNPNGNIVITTSGTGSIVLDNQTWPENAGTNGQVLSTDGAGNVLWKTLPQINAVQGPGSSTNNALAIWDGTSGALLKNSTILYSASGTLTNVTDLKVGNLELTSSTISSTNTNGNIDLTPNGTGHVVLDGLSWPDTDGSNTQVLTTDGAGTLFWSNGGGGGGGVTGPLSSTDTAIATWNGTGGSALRNSATLVDTTTGKITSVGSTTTPGSIQLNEAPSTGSAGVVISAPSSVTGYTMKLPSAQGATGQVLVNSDGAGTMAWAGAGTLLDSATASNTFSIVFQLPTTYNVFRIYMSKVVLASGSGTSEDYVGMQFSSDGGTTWFSGSSDYKVVYQDNNGSSIVPEVGIVFAIGVCGPLSLTAGTGIYGAYVDIIGAHDSTVPTVAICNSHYLHNVTGLNNGLHSGNRQANEAHNAIRLISGNGGNISTGSFYIYGMS